MQQLIFFCILRGVHIVNFVYIYMYHIEIVKKYIKFSFLKGAFVWNNVIVVYILYKIYDKIA